MATTPPTIPNPTTAPTPAPPTEPSTLALREAAVAATLPAPSAEPPAPTGQPIPTAPAAPPAEAYTIVQGEGGVEIKLATGAVYKGANLEAAVAELAKGKVESDRTIRQMRNQPAPTPEPVPVVPEAVVEAPEEIQAREWMLKQQAKAIGVDPETYVRMMKLSFETAQQTQQATLAAAFMQLTPDFPNTEVASDALLEIAQREGFPATARGLKAAHDIAVAEGRYQPVMPVVQPGARPLPAPILSPSAPVVSGNSFDESKAYDKNTPISQVRAWAEQAERERRG